jgi:hypothetical protein
LYLNSEFSILFGEQRLLFEASFANNHNTLILCLEFEPDIGGSHLIAPLSFYFENPLPLWRSKYLFQFSDVESFVISISTGI